MEPAGEHGVVFRYDTSLLKRGVVVSASVFGAATLLLVLSLVFTMKGRKGGITHRGADI